MPKPLSPKNGIPLISLSYGASFFFPSPQLLLASSATGELEFTVAPFARNPQGSNNIDVIGVRVSLVPVDRQVIIRLWVDVLYCSVNPSLWARGS